MLTNNENEFLIYWEKKRLENKFNPFFFGKGFAAGVSIGLLIIICIAVGWNKQAAMNELNIPIITISFLCIAFFCALFYNNFKYEQNEQAYQELLHKKSKQDLT